MAQKGSIEVDTHAIEKVIVRGNMYKYKTDEACKGILHECEALINSDALTGGGGDEIVDALKVIEGGCHKLSQSTATITKAVDEKLAKAFSLSKENQALVDDIKSQTKNVGVKAKE